MLEEECLDNEIAHFLILCLILECCCYILFLITTPPLVLADVIYLLLLLAFVLLVPCLFKDSFSSFLIFCSCFCMSFIWLESSLLSVSILHSLYLFFFLL